MIKSKIFYSLCIAALGLPFAGAMETMPNWSDEDCLSPRKRHASQGECPKKKDNSTSDISQFSSSSNSERERPTNTLNFQSETLQQLNVLSQPVYDLTEDLRDEPTKNAQSVEPSSEDVKNMIDLSTYLMVYGGTYDETKATLKRIFRQSTVEKYTPSMYKQMNEKFGSYCLWFFDMESLDLFAEQYKEFIRKELCGYDITKETANALLTAINDTSYDKANRKAREALERELQALGVCRTNAEYGDDLLKIQLEAFLNPNKHKDNPRNAYNELVWESMDQSRLTDRQEKALKYLISIDGENEEIRDTFKDVFMRTLDDNSVRKYRRKNSKESQKKTSYKGVFCEESFNETGASLELTELEKKRLTRSIRGYKINMLKLVTFLSRPGCGNEYISSTLKELYNKDYTEEEEIIDLRSNALRTLSKIPSISIAKELNALWTYQPSVDSEKDREKCEIVKSLLAQH